MPILERQVCFGLELTLKEKDVSSSDKQRHRQKRTQFLHLFAESEIKVCVTKAVQKKCAVKEFKKYITLHNFGCPVQRYLSSSSNKLVT